MTIEDTVGFRQGRQDPGGGCGRLLVRRQHLDAADPLFPGYQVQYAQAVREGADIATMAVNLILDAKLAEDIVATGKADLIALARPVLDDPNFAIHALPRRSPEPRLRPGADPGQERSDRLAQSLRHMTR